MDGQCHLGAPGGQNHIVLQVATVGPHELVAGGTEKHPFPPRQRAPCLHRTQGFGAVGGSVGHPELARACSIRRIKQHAFTLTQHRQAEVSAGQGVPVRVKVGHHCRRVGLRTMNVKFAAVDAVVGGKEEPREGAGPHGLIATRGH